MPARRADPASSCTTGRPVLVVIMEPQRNQRQAQVRVSRASKAFVHRLLEAEVP
jgi:transcription antitermination factor NusA-like protein